MINSSSPMKKWEKMNTIAHLNAAFGARIGRNLLLQNKISTSDNEEINLNIRYAIMIKEISSSEEIRKLVSRARSLGLEISEFTKEMIETTDDRKVISSTGMKKWKDINYLGVLIF